MTAASASAPRPSLAGATRAELADALRAIDTPERDIKMRVSQLWHWIYFRGARDFSEMLNISKILRGTLAEHFTLALPEIAAEQVSTDGTRKWLLRLDPVDAQDKGAEVECVYIPESDRGTLCVSSQVGCTLNCSFCHTGTQKLVRNLTTREIVAQLLVARMRLGDFPGLEPPTDGLVPSGPDVRAVSNIVWPVARRKLDQLNIAHLLEDLRAPPANHLEPLKGDRKGQHSIRINDQFRVCFNWTARGPENVEIVDYH